MSITGTATGKPATTASLVVRASPRHSATSVDVPPISKVMMSFIPATEQRRRAQTTPPAGQHSIARSGSAEAVDAETDPPFDFITRSACGLLCRASSFELTLGFRRLATELNPSPNALR